MVFRLDEYQPRQNQAENARDDEDEPGPIVFGKLEAEGDDRSYTSGAAGMRDDPRDRCLRNSNKLNVRSPTRTSRPRHL